ncbi:hypothetical protein, partial [Paraprevotella clara]|uniref:hypothetical protein n=1 Tax=Paraprevotella clara TaxID=454154 RepID=UPI0026702165
RSAPPVRAGGPGRGEGGDGEPAADGYGVTFEDVILLYHLFINQFIFYEEKVFVSLSDGRAVAGSLFK